MYASAFACNPCSQQDYREKTDDAKAAVRLQWAEERLAEREKEWLEEEASIEQDVKDGKYRSFSRIVQDRGAVGIGRWVHGEYVVLLPSTRTLFCPVASPPFHPDCALH